MSTNDIGIDSPTPPSFAQQAANNLALRAAGQRSPMAGHTGSLMDASSWSARTYLFTASDTAAATVYWPWVIRTDQIASPLGRYYMYFSTDHDAGSGGIYLAYSNSLMGPWTQYGLVYQDLASTASGQGQTETPSVIWDPYVSKFRMFYQNYGAKYGSGNSLTALGQQSTLSATSTDGKTWTKDPNFILDMPSTTAVHGDGHTGYFLPFATRRGLFGYSLGGGTSGSDFILWKCRGADWESDWKPLGYATHMTSTLSTTRVIAWNHSFVVESSGVEYLVARFTTGNGGAAANDDRIVVAPISADYRSLMATPTIIWSGDQVWEGVNLRTLTPFVENGFLYIFYDVNGKIGVFRHVL